MSNWIVGGVELTGDLQWIDEFEPARRQIETPTLAGGVDIQKSIKVAGIPVTLQTPEKSYVLRQNIIDLTALIEDNATDVFAVVHPNGTTMNCRWRYGSGKPLDWSNTWFISPPQPSHGWHTLTLRMMTA